MQACLVEVALAAGQHAAVVAEVEDERFFEQALGVELVDDLADLCVHHRLQVVVRPVGLAEQRGVRMAGGDELGVGHAAGVGRLKLALVRDRERLLVEERLARGPAVPVLAGVPDFAFVGEVVIGLRVVGRVIARLSHQRGDGVEALGQLGRLDLPVELTADAGDVAADRQAGPGRRADGTVGERLVEDHAAAGQLLDPRRLGPVLVVELEVVDGVVLAHQPDHVGPIALGGLGGGHVFGEGLVGQIAGHDRTGGAGDGIAQELSA